MLTRTEKAWAERFCYHIVPTLVFVSLIANGCNPFGVLVSGAVYATIRLALWKHWPTPPTLEKSHERRP